MKNYIAVIIFALFVSSSVFAQKTFLLKDASKSFDLKIEIANCEEDSCEGKANYYLMKKSEDNSFQTIKMENGFLELGEDQKPTANLIELYGMNNSGVVFDDFNFDLMEDIAIRNGNEGAYGGPSYSIFVYSKATKKFVENKSLTALASENLGLFEVNPKTKTLETFTKSGCCWHQTTRYSIANNRPKKVYVFTEDAAGGDGTYMSLVTETLLKSGKWKKTTKRVKTANYYKDQ
jgi:hypothetical protein